MVTRERIEHRGNELRDLRERYNQLCSALAFGVNANADSGERLLQELQIVMRRMIAIEAQHQGAESGPVSSTPHARDPAPESTPTPDQATAPHSASPRASNVIAFRVRMKGTADQQPGFIPEMDKRSLEVHRDNRLSTGATRPKGAVSARDEGSNELRTAIMAQGEAILVISNRCDEHKARLARLEGQGPATADLRQFADDVVALRGDAEKQRQQLIVLATAVHRLARLLASEPGHDAAG
ncbi:MAG: hypothetical protein ACREEE_15615 [Dongiaceae bacterium]